MSSRRYEMLRRPWSVPTSPLHIDVDPLTPSLEAKLVRAHEDILHVTLVPSQKFIEALCKRRPAVFDMLEGRDGQSK